LYCLPIIIRAIKARRMIWVRIGTHEEKREMHIGFSCGNLKESDDSGEIGTDGRIILKWILERWNVDSMD